MTNETERLRSALQDMQLNWVRFYKDLPDGEYNNLGEMRQASVHAGKALIGEDYGEPDGHNMQASIVGDGKQQEARMDWVTWLDDNLANEEDPITHLPPPFERRAELMQEAFDGYARQATQPSHASGELSDYPGEAYFREHNPRIRAADEAGDADYLRKQEALGAAFQRGQQAMAEKAAQLRETVLAILMDPYIGNFSMYKQFAAPKADAIEAAIRSLAGAEPDFIPNKENE